MAAQAIPRYTIATRASGKAARREASLPSREERTTMGLVALPEPDRAIVSRRDAIAADLRRLVGPGAVISNEDGRRGLFADLGRRATRVAVISEGLVVYLMADAVAALARDLAGPPAFQHWALDMASPGLIEMMKSSVGRAVSEAGAPFLFAPTEGPPFFAAHGWQPIEVRSLLKTAGKLGRLPFALRMFAMLPESDGAQGSRPWSGVCLFARQTQP